MQSKDTPEKGAFALIVPIRTSGILTPGSSLDLTRATSVGALMERTRRLYPPSAGLSPRRIERRVSSGDAEFSQASSSADRTCAVPGTGPSALRWARTRARLVTGTSLRSAPSARSGAMA
ncbi:MAG TPA: hypothetical protein IAA40_01650 [Candidatus Olsenella excrementigallinarum]|nr:hypothetical protein [Candidatus Olsenella excrementigallinarum]